MPQDRQDAHCPARQGDRAARRAGPRVQEIADQKRLVHAVAVLRDVFPVASADGLREKLHFRCFAVRVFHGENYTTSRTAARIPTCKIPLARGFLDG